MADRLMRLPVAGFLLLAQALLLSLAVSEQAQAQMPLADPTRPPSGVLEAATPGEAAGGRVLQSVLIPRQGKPLAVIDGQQVRLGQRYGESRLVKVSEREVVLEGPQGIERLQLTPGVEKTNISPVTGTKRRPARNEG